MSVKMKSSGQSGQKRGETETSYEERRTYGKYPNRDGHPLSQRICSNAISHYSTPFFFVVYSILSFGTTLSRSIVSHRSSIGADGCLLDRTEDPLLVSWKAFASWWD